MLMSSPSEENHVPGNSSKRTLSVVTLNCWALPSIPLPIVGCRQKLLRIDKLIEALSESKFDIVTLQELWSESDYLRIVRNPSIKRLYPHSHYFHSGLLGSGICILSRYPIESVLMHRYSLNGYPHHVHRGDWFGGKIIGMIKILFGQYLIAFYTTHLHAEYNSLNDIYLSHRISQCFELTQFIRETSSNADFVVLTGDFNLEPCSDGYNIITNIGQLEDAWIAAHEYEMAEGMTNERPDNCYSPLHLFKSSSYAGKRLDYIMFRSGRVNVKVQSCEICLNKIPDSKFNYSDHVGVKADFVLRENKGNSLSRPLKKKYDAQQLLNNMMEIVERRENSVNCDRRVYQIGFFFSVAFVLFLSIYVPSNYIVKTMMIVGRFLVPFPMMFCLWYWIIGVRLEEKAIKESKYTIRKLLRLPDMSVANLADLEKDGAFQQPPDPCTEGSVITTISSVDEELIEK